jgi:hypothetical protein
VIRLSAIPVAFRPASIISIVLLGACLSSPPAKVHAATSIDAIPVCYNFGCKVREIVAITDEEWEEVSGWFRTPAPNPEEEREQIKRAIGWMEVVIGKHTPTHRDKGLDLEYGAEFPGQMDCIDESLNTTTYLTLFENHGLLRHHRVLDRAYRRAIFDQHWAGQIEEIASGKRFAVDSWFHDNGILPYVQEMSEWEDIPFFFSSYVDNSTEYQEYRDSLEKKSRWQSIKDRFSRQRDDSTRID